MSGLGIHCTIALKPGFSECSLYIVSSNTAEALTLAAKAGSGKAEKLT